MKNKIFVYLLGGFFILFVATQIFLISNNKKNQPEPNSTEQEQVVSTPTMAPSTGSLTLTSESSTFPVGGNVTISLSAESNEKNIVGYDVVLLYDPVNFEFISAESKLPDFKIYSYKKSGYLVLTGVKNLGSQTPTVFDKTDIADLAFQPKKAGQYTFSLKTSSDKDKTDFITDNTEVLNPVLNELTVDIE